MKSPWRRAPSLFVLFAFALMRPAGAVEPAKSPTSSSTASPSPASSPPGPLPATPARRSQRRRRRTRRGPAGAEHFKGEDLGHVVDLVVDRNGALLAAIVDFGGFLGVGSRKIAVDWRILHFPKTGALAKLVADLPLDQLRAAPAYKPGEAIVIMGGSPAPAPTPTPARATPSAALSSPAPKP